MKTTDADFPVGTDADVAGTIPQVRIARISDRTFAVMLAGKERARFNDLSAAFFWARTYFPKDQNSTI